MGILSSARPIRAKRALALAAATAALVGGSLAANASPAAAYTAACAVNLTQTSCSTGNVSAHPYGHYVRYSVDGGIACAQADWKVVDRNNGVTVRSGHTGIGNNSGTISGLYSTYYLRITNSCWPATGRLMNDY